MTGGAAYYSEIDPYCAQWLQNLIAAGHIPPGDVDTRDVREVSADDLRGYGQVHLFAGIGGFAHAARLAGLPDDFPVLTGGFPCQPFSCAGERRGISDDRHLWPEMHRLVAALRPRWVLGENVAGLVGMALDGVLSDLEGSGYACWPALIPACAVDAPHRRDRLWIVAHRDVAGSHATPYAGVHRVKESAGPRDAEPQRLCGVGDVADPDQSCTCPKRQQRGGQQRRAGGDTRTCDVEHAALFGRREGRPQSSLRGGRSAATEPSGVDVGDAYGPRLPQPEQREQPGGAQRGLCPWSAIAEPGGARWLAGADGKARRIPQSRLRGVAHGVSAGMDGDGAEPEAATPLLIQRHEYDYSAGARIARLKALGNAIVPQVAAEIMRAMFQADQDAERNRGRCDDSGPVRQDSTNDGRSR